MHDGRHTRGIVRMGDTVRRPLHARSDYVHALLDHLAAVGFPGAPRVLGVDDEGREMLTYIPGEVVYRSPAGISDAQIVSAAGLVRAFHDATAGTPFAAGDEVVGHGDLGPHNIVFDGDQAIGIIDWDEDVGPCARVVDAAHAAWCCADVCEREVPVGDQARKLRLFCDAYGGIDVAAVVDELAARFTRARDHHADGGRAEAVAIFDAMIAWMDRHGAALKAPPGKGAI